jgi:hypothetical protein
MVLNEIELGVRRYKMENRSGRIEDRGWQAEG